MKKYLVAVFLFSLGMICSNEVGLNRETGASADTLAYDANVTSLADGDTFFADLHYHPPFDSIQAILNGRISTDNFKSTMSIAQRFIDSTNSPAHASNWIDNYTKRIIKWTTASILQMRNGRGIDFYLNDTTANNGAFRIYSDSAADFLVSFAEDSLRLLLPTNIDSAIITGNDSIWTLKPIIHRDSVIANLGIRGKKNVRADSLVSDKGARITNTIIGDSANINTGIQADRGIFDSIKIGGGSWVKTMATGGFVMKIMKQTDTTAVVWTDSAHYYLFNDNVSLNFDFSDPVYNTTKTSLDTTFLVSGIQSIIKPSSTKTIYVPVEINSPILVSCAAGMGPSITPASYLKITSGQPIDTLRLFMDIASVVCGGTDLERNITVKECNLSYSKN